ncbi:Cytochrome P450 85A1 [Hordeum vulgare]|nr:Cytochrome P450 85A1 [Hordeum vulgare]
MKTPSFFTSSFSAQYALAIAACKKKIMGPATTRDQLLPRLPGTSYYQGFQARKKLVSMLEQMTREKLSDEQIIDLLIALIYSGYETISTTSMMAVKYLSDHPQALEELRREHLDIRKGKSLEEAISYEDFKSMAFTRAVIFETLRLATVVNGLLRKTTQDVEMNGEICLEINPTTNLAFSRKMLS